MMSTKEHILKILENEILLYKQELNTCYKLYADPLHPDIHFYTEKIKELESLITPVKSAIFDLPSEQEEEEQFIKNVEEKVTITASLVYSMGWEDAKRYFLNYKKE